MRDWNRVVKKDSALVQEREPFTPRNTRAQKPFEFSISGLRVSGQRRQGAGYPARRTRREWARLLSRCNYRKLITSGKNKSVNPKIKPKKIRSFISKKSQAYHASLLAQTAKTPAIRHNESRRAGQPESRPETPADKPATRKTPGTISAPPRSLRAGTRFTRAYTRTRTCEPANRLKSPISRRRPGANTNLQACRPKCAISDFSATAGHSRVNARGQKLPSLRAGWKNVNSNFVFLFFSYRTGGGGKAANELARLASELAG